MKCIYCGRELEDGELVCPGCNKPVQLVPDYSVYEDDYLKQVLAEENQPGKRKPKTKPVESSQSAVSQKPDMRQLKQQKKKQIKLMWTLGAVALVLVLALLVLAAAVRSNHANSVSYQLAQAQKMYAKRNLTEAVSYYERALELDSNNNEIRLALADLYVELEEYKKAEELYKSVIKNDKSNRKACKGLIGIYEKQDDLDAIRNLHDTVDTSLDSLFKDYLVTEPEFSLEAGIYKTGQTLILRAVKDYKIYYTLDGTDPVAHGILYNKPVELDENGKTYRIKAVCMNNKNIYSEVKEVSITIQIPAPDMPIVTPDGGDFGIKTTVSITVPDGCSAYYTWDGSTPNAYSQRYARPILIPEGNHILSVIIIDNATNLSSEVYRGHFVYYDSNLEDDGESIEEE